MAMEKFVVLKSADKALLQACGIDSEGMCKMGSNSEKPWFRHYRSGAEIFIYPAEDNQPNPAPLTMRQKTLCEECGIDPSGVVVKAETKMAMRLYHSTTKNNVAIFKGLAQIRKENGIW